MFLCFFFHKWGVWENVGHFYQKRYCARCKKKQNRYIEIEG